MCSQDQAWHLAFFLLVGELCHGLTENAVECLLGAGGLSLSMVLHWSVVGNMQVWARAGAQLVDFMPGMHRALVYVPNTE